ncbi:hypothetical protein F4775DRAFT_531836, partial [Biscogniauxia sp. FL1348]
MAVGWCYLGFPLPSAYLYLLSLPLAQNSRYIPHVRKHAHVQIPRGNFKHGLHLFPVLDRCCVSTYVTPAHLPYFI